MNNDNWYEGVADISSLYDRIFGYLYNGYWLASIREYKNGISWTIYTKEYIKLNEGWVPNGNLEEVKQRCIRMLSERGII